MKKKYSIFVSSTYLDLKKEREIVRDAIIKMGHSPIGMEYFPASNKTQWQVIKDLIVQCDYYILIIGGRYGSIEEDSQISYTQKEFIYASDHGIPILSFILDPNANHLSNKRRETDDETNKKMSEFRAAAEKKLCKYWTTRDNLITDVVISLYSEMESNPQIGWVRDAPQCETNHMEVKVPINDEQNVITPSWIRIQDCLELKDENIDQDYADLMSDLSNNLITDATSLASSIFALSFLYDNNIKESPKDIEFIIRGCSCFVLSKCLNREGLYDCRLEFSKMINLHSVGKKTSETLVLFCKYFYDEYKCIWNQMRDAMTIALEDITDSNAGWPKQLLMEAVADHSVVYQWADVFDKVDIDKMCSSVKKLKSASINVLTSFFIERYKLRYYLQLDNNDYVRPKEIDNLKKFALWCSSMASSTDGIKRIAYRRMRDIVNLSIKRVQGDTTLLLNTSE